MYICVCIYKWVRVGELLCVFVVYVCVRVDVRMDGRRGRGGGVCV